MAYYIAHHGILGQKWGVRRYQNPDGTLTEAGKKRYDRNPIRSEYINNRDKARSAVRAMQRTPDNYTIEERKKLKVDYKEAKNELRRIKDADKGRRLIEKGKTAYGEAKKAEILKAVGRAAAIAAIAYIGYKAYTSFNPGFEHFPILEGTNVRGYNVFNTYNPDFLTSTMNVGGGAEAVVAALATMGTMKVAADHYTRNVRAISAYDNHRILEDKKKEDEEERLRKKRES